MKWMKWERCFCVNVLYSVYRILTDKHLFYLVLYYSNMKPKTRYITFKLPPTIEEKNAIYRSLDTKETKKLIKNPKKIKLENIFIKTKSKKK